MKPITTFQFNENKLHFLYVRPSHQTFGSYTIRLNDSKTDWELIIGESGEDKWLELYNGNECVKDYPLHQTELTIDLVTEIFKYITY